MNKPYVTLYIPRLGGVDNFRLSSAEDAWKCKYARYVCTYFAKLDECEMESGDYDIVQLVYPDDPPRNEYVAIPLQG